MKNRLVQQIATVFAFLSLTIMFMAGCRKGSETGTQPTATSSPKDQTPFERNLEYVRQGHFHFVFVFSLKDGGVFTKDDIAYLKANSPPETNQWVSSEGGKRVIAGTNFEFKPEHFDALSQRFNIEDYTGK